MNISPDVENLNEPVNEPAVYVAPMAKGLNVEGYILDKELGRGGFGWVWFATRKDSGNRFVIKQFIICPDGYNVNDCSGHYNEEGFEYAQRNWLFERVNNERLIQLNLCSRYIHCTSDFFTQPKGLYAAGTALDGDLSDLPSADNNFTFVDLINLAVSAIKGLYLLHSNGMAHRDIKPENFLFSIEGNSYRFKYTDFGISCGMRDAMSCFGSIKGSYFYLSPDLWKAFHLLDNATNKQAEKIRDRYYTQTNAQRYDVWALGITLFVMMRKYQEFSKDRELDKDPTAYFPFDKPTYENIKKGRVFQGLIKNADLKDQDSPNVARWFNTVVDSMIQVNPERRATAKQLVDQVHDDLIIYLNNNISFAQPMQL